MLTRTLATVALAAAVFLAVASAGHAAPAPPRWCGTDEATADRLPDAVASYQLHAVYAIPSDGTDRYFQDAPLIARDLAAIDSWWIGQDPTRTLRWDLQAFPGCDSTFGGLDISFLRLPLPASAYVDPQNGGYSNLVRGLGTSFLDPYKKYAVFYDGPIDPSSGVCGVSSFGPTDRGASYAFTLVQADAADGLCGSLGNSDYMAQTAVHEVVHNLGAVSSSAPHVCMGGHVCDSVDDLMAAFGTSNSLFDYALDVGRDDYYGHSGSWWDVQDSAWLSHRNAPQFPLTVTATGSGKVTSNLPGIACPPACSIPWDSGTAVSLTAETSGDNRFAGWTGACSGDTCNLTMDAAKSVGARFVAQATMHVVRRGSGSVSSRPEGINCPASCESLFDVGSSVALTAKPAKGSRVVAWSVRSCGTDDLHHCLLRRRNRQRHVRPGDDAPGRVGRRRRARDEHAGRDLVPDPMRSRVPGDHDGSTTADAVEGLAIQGLDRSVPRQGRLRGQGRRSPRHLQQGLGLARLAHEPLARRADERDRLGEQDAHRVAEGDRLLVRPALRLDLAQRGGGQLDRGVQRQRRELLALCLRDRLRLLLGELAQAAHQILGVTAKGKVEAAFHRPSSLARGVYPASTSDSSSETSGLAFFIASANGDDPISPRACSSRRAAKPIASRYSGEATRGVAAIVRSSASAASSASSIPSGAR